jgi:RNA polymerase sigma-70 factor, ECF subfamily
MMGSTGPDADFDAVFRDSLPGVVHTVWLIVGDEEVARELAHDAFVAALQRWPKVRRLDNPGAWVRRVAVNRAIDDRRRGARWRLVGRAPAAQPPSLDRSVDEPVDVHRALLRLPPAQRAAVVLHYLHDLPVAEVAATLGVTPGTVKTHLHRARASLAPLLGEPEELSHDAG